MELLEKALDQEQTKKRTYITIEPFFDANVFNMGLERYGQVLFEGTEQVEDLGSITVAGVERYRTGLDEFAPEVKLLPDEERKAKVKEIRKVVAKLELELAQNVLDIDDEKFWSKVILLQPSNKEFWSKITLKVSSAPTPLDPSEPTDLIRIHAIEAGGFDLVAPSLDAARSSKKAYKFYMSRLEDTSAARTEIKKLRNKAKGKLEELRNAKQNKLFLVSKVYLSPENNFTRSTPIDTMYDVIDDKLDGINSKDKKKEAIIQFLDIVKADNQTLLIYAYVKDAIFFRTLAQKSDRYYYTPLGSMCGKNISECIEFFKNPLNEKELEELILRVEKRWT